jgi:hypothetical protein
MRFLLLALTGICACALADEQAIHRAVIQRDQQSAEFAARVRGEDTTRLEQLHARQLADAMRPIHPDPELARHLRSYERHKMADERALVLPPPTETLAKPVERPLPLPGGQKHGVDPIPAQGFGH